MCQDKLVVRGEVDLRYQRTDKESYFALQRENYGGHLGTTAHQ